ncbi:MAG: hypothetical protein ACLQAT_15620 [Candidatus Binataceae bacterium]
MAVVVDAVEIVVVAAVVAEEPVAEVVAAADAAIAGSLKNRNDFIARQVSPRRRPAARLFSALGACLLAPLALVSSFAVQISILNHRCRRQEFRAILVALVVAIAALSSFASADEGTPSQPLRNVAGIVTHHGGKLAPVGTAFFVAVPSHVFEGRSFVYLVTAHHNLLDADGSAAPGLLLTFEDAKTGATREEPLPPEGKWVLDPTSEAIDVAAVPFNPSGANIAPIPLGSIMATESEMAALADTGAQTYYLTAASVGISKPRFEALARFGRVSVARPLDAEVPGAGVQQLCFMDGGGTPGFSSGAPVFIETGLRFVLWGILESTNSASATSTFQGLAGLLPANSVAETVEAMAAAQERNLRAPR